MKALDVVDRKSERISKDYGKKHSDPHTPSVMADAQPLRHVSMNIINIAAQAMGGYGAIATRESSGREREVIDFAGPGFFQELLEPIFEPFITTEKEGKGTGLGLSAVHGIIENHGRTISAKSVPGCGSTFSIELPIAHESGKGAEHAEHA